MIRGGELVDYSSSASPVASIHMVSNPSQLEISAIQRNVPESGWELAVGGVKRPYVRAAR